VKKRKRGKRKKGEEISYLPSISAPGEKKLKGRGEKGKKKGERGGGKEANCRSIP